MRRLWADVEALDLGVDASTQIEMLLEARRLVERATAGCFAAGRAHWTSAPRSSASPPAPQPWASVARRARADRARGARGARAALAEQGVPDDLARRVACLSDRFAALDIVGVADATGSEIDEVAALHFLVGGRLHLHWLRDRIATLPRENRWQAMARAALRDDLFSLHAELTADILRGTGPELADAEARLDGWIDANRPLVERCLGILSDIRTGGTYDLTTLPVALRELRNLIQAAAAAS